MKKNLIVILTAVFVFGSVLSDIRSAFGQDEFTLEEITVTAEKREENLQSVPVAIEAVMGSNLQEMGKVDFYDALQGVTSLIMQEGSRGFIVSLRGMSNDQGGQDSPVAVNIDGDYTRREEAGMAGLLDVNRIEVLNGPQGTLYGRLSTAGVVNIISNDPTDSYEVSGLIEAGSYGLLHSDVLMNVPLNDAWALRGAFRSIERDGYMSNGESDADEKTARFKSRFTPNDYIDLILTVENTKTGGRGTGATMAFGDQPANAWTSYYDEYDTYRDTEVIRYVADLNLDLGFGELTFHPSYRKHELHMGWILSGNWQARYEGTDEVASELRLSSPADSKIDWLVGLYMYKRDQIEEDDDYDPGHDRYWVNYGDVDSRAAFGSASYPISDRIRLNGGLRYTSDEEHTSGERYGTPQTPSDTDLTNTDYKIGIEYDVSDSSLLWADFSTGFRAGKMNNDPEYLDAYQLGSKNRFLDDALQLNWSAFYYDYQGYQSENYLLAPDGSLDMGGGSGDAELIGVDVQTSYLMSEQDRLDVSVSYLKATYTNVVMNYNYNPTEYYAGAVMTNSPTLAVSANYNHDFYLNNGSIVRAHIDTRFETKSYVKFALSARYTWPEGANLRKANHVSNASLAYMSADQKWTLTSYIKNIENYARKNHILGNTMRIGPPRTYGLMLSLHYY